MDQDQKKTVEGHRRDDKLKHNSKMGQSSQTPFQLTSRLATEKINFRIVREVQAEMKTRYILI